MNNRLANIYKRLTDRNTWSGVPNFYFVYISWAVAVAVVYAVAISDIGLFALRLLLATGALFVLVNLCWWVYQTIPYRLRVFRKNIRTRRWRRKAAKTYRPVEFSPSRQLSLVEKWKARFSRLSLLTRKEQSP